jgi:MFS family permease
MTATSSPASDLPGAFSDPMSAVDGTAFQLGASAVSWPAVIAGAVTAAAVSVLLFVLGAGLGFAAAPMGHANSEAVTFTVWAAIWMIVIQWLASGLGGYMAGRLRHRWHGVREDETHFRDTANGFLSWALATVMVAVLAAATAGFATSAVSHHPGAAPVEPHAYQLDVLFRSPTSNATVSDPATRTEAGRILTHVATEKQVSEDDRVYLTQMVAMRAGVTPAIAQARTDAAINQVRAMADQARKAAEGTGLFTALAMIIGAFIASVCGVLGGRQRDHHL